MDNNKYQLACLNFKRNDYNKSALDNEDLLHSVLGLTTETGELANTIKVHFAYKNKEDKLDIVNIVEEFGDLLWYIAIGLNSVGSSIDEAMEKNIAKLSARYKSGKFSADDALRRDLHKERSVLEDASNS